MGHTQTQQGAKQRRARCVTRSPGRTTLPLRLESKVCRQCRTPTWWKGENRPAMTLDPPSPIVRLEIVTKSPPTYLPPYIFIGVYINIKSLYWLFPFCLSSCISLKCYFSSTRRKRKREKPHLIINKAFLPLLRSPGGRWENFSFWGAPRCCDGRPRQRWKRLMAQLHLTRRFFFLKGESLLLFVQFFFFSFSSSSAFCEYIPPTHSTTTTILLWLLYSLLRPTHTHTTYTRQEREASNPEKRPRHTRNRMREGKRI